MSQGGGFGNGGSGGSGIATINTVGPDGGGNFNITSNDSSVTITPGTNGVDLSVEGGTSVTFSAAMTTNQTLAEGGLVQVTYDTVLVDTASGYSAGVYTVPVGGTGNWMITLQAGFATAVSFSACDLFINKNVGSYLIHVLPSTPSSFVTASSASASGVFPLIAGDTVQINVFASTSGGVTFDALGFANGYYNVFSMYKVS